MSRKPGRPRGSKNKVKPTVLAEPGLGTAPPQPIAPVDAPSVTAEPTFDPTTFTGGFTTGVGEQPPEPAPGIEPEPEPARKRGRPAGPRTQINVSGMEQLLLGIHATLLAATGVPEFELSEQEARQIAESYTEICKHYPSFNVDPKHAAIVNFGSTLSIVYGSRFISWRTRRASERPQSRRSPVAPQPAEQPIPPQPVMADQINGIPLDPRTQPPPMPTEEIRTGEIPGLGTIVFGEDHPLVSGRKQ